MNETITTSFLGILRGSAVIACTNPLDVIKTCQQDSSSKRSAYQVARSLFKEDGIKSYYRGIKPKWISYSIKQIWCWPAITTLPSLIDQGPFLSLLFTVTLIGTVDSATTTPLNKLMVKQMTKHEVSKYESLTKGWSGFQTNWVKATFGWNWFLITQHYYRKQYKTFFKKETLNHKDLTLIGTAIGVTGNLVGAPIDLANTICQSKETKITTFIKKTGYLSLWRGCPLSITSAVINNIISLYLIHYIETKKSK